MPDLIEGSRPAGRRSYSRRSVTRAAAWSVPAVAVVSAAPAFAASAVDVGAFALRGSCGASGIVGPGFLLTAGPTALPVGNTVIITGSGVADIGTFRATGAGTATVTYLSGSSRFVTVTTEIPAGETMALRTSLSTATQTFQLNAAASLPEGYTGTGAKTAAIVSSTTTLCNAT
ncbi:hypothetical protein [Nocardioides alkalitolerans]|uniref:hypothetical protein n=1 Tax=Nocardioides alkalitolerans TaxID=281714 RepID=UPI000401BB85|nr:hypothetical protein [Nocardioides alkalitolerans]